MLHLVTLDKKKIKMKSVLTPLECGVMLQVSWTEMHNNTAILQRGKEGRNMMKYIIKRQLIFLGHTMREDNVYCREDRRFKSQRWINTAYLDD